MTFKRTYERWGLKDGEGKLRIETSGGQGSRRALAPSDDDDDDDDDDNDDDTLEVLSWNLCFDIDCPKIIQDFR
jgi:hypothetical protein